MNELITYPLNNIDYSAEDAGLFHCGRTSGILSERSFSISATGADNNITIGKGVGWIANDELWGKVTALKEDTSLELDIADSIYDRIDAIAIQFDANANSTSLVVKKGTASSNPQIPPMSRTESLYELYLCTVYRAAGATSIPLSAITDRRLDEGYCGLMVDSIARVDTEAISRQIEALISRLEEEIRGVHDGSDLMQKSQIYPVGSVFVTKTNRTPGEILGGEWVLRDKMFSSFISLRENVFSADTYFAKGQKDIVFRRGHDVTVKLKIEITSEDVTQEENRIIGDFDFEQLGIIALPYQVSANVFSSDDMNGVGIYDIDSTTGRLTWRDFIRKGGSAEIIFPTGSTFFITHTFEVDPNNMLDEFCDRFFWERIQ